MDIPAKAKKCPFCHHWQHWLSLTVVHPAFGFVFFAIPLMIFYILITVWFHNQFSKGEPFQKYAGQITVVESKIEFGQDHNGPVVAVVGKIKNTSPVDWKEVRIHAEFFNAKDALIDVDQQSEYQSPSLPAGQEIGFKVYFPRQFPEKEYVRHKIRVISAKDARESFWMK
jgi:hypothetical protein